MTLNRASRPLNTMLASAQRVTSRTLQRGWGKSKAWQKDAWEVFDLVGELHFLAATLAQRMSQARFYVGQVSADPTEEPTPVEDQRFTDILDSIGGSTSARAQLIARLGVNLFVTGDGWIVGIPRHLIPPTLLVGTLSDPLIDPALIPVPDPGQGMNIADMDWRMLSIDEVSTLGSGELQLKLGETAAEQIMCSPDDLILIRVWRPHPRFWWEADSPTRSSLPVLRELVGMTMRSSAEIDSRLAGAGLLIVPQSAQRALQIAAGIEDDVDTAQDQFTEALMQAMITPIQDRASASAVVPLVATVPDEACDKFKFMTFSEPLDITSGERMDKVIRRLALGLDAPPELLLGTGGLNHWGAWLVDESVVGTHLEPPLALICDALTTQFLWPVLVDQGMPIDDAKQYVIWNDVSGLVVQPTRAADAVTLHAAGAISDAALREATGFDDSDAPEGSDKPQPIEVTLALELVKGAPSLMQDPGLPQLVAQIRAAIAGDIPAVIDPVAARAAAAPPPATGGSAAPEPAGTAGGGPMPPVAAGAPPSGPTSSGPPARPSIAASAADLPEYVHGWTDGGDPAPERSPSAEEIDEFLANPARVALP